MQDENREKFVDDTRQELNHLAGEVGRLQQSIEQSNVETERTRNQIQEYGNELQSHNRKRKGLWAVVVLLAVALAGLSWYGNQQLLEQGNQLSELLGIGTTIRAAAERIGDVEDKLIALTMDRDKMTGQLTSLEKRVYSILGRAKTQAQDIASQMEQRMKVALDQGKVALDQGLEAVHARLGKIESTQEADRVRDAALRTDLSQMRQEMASLREEANRQIEDVRQDGARGLSDLNQRLVANFTANRNDLDALSNRLGHERVSFEISEDQAEEVIPGIRLTVNHTKVDYQRIDGWLHVVPDGRILWIHSQSIDQPITFYVENEDRPFQIVFTRVLDHNATGYVLLPNPVTKTAATRASIQ